jgi:hypothetical protein
MSKAWITGALVTLVVMAGILLFEHLQCTDRPRLRSAKESAVAGERRPSRQGASGVVPAATDPSPMQESAPASQPNAELSAAESRTALELWFRSVDAAAPPLLEGSVTFEQSRTALRFHANADGRALVVGAPWDDHGCVSISTPGWHVVLPPSSSAVDARMGRLALPTQAPRSLEILVAPNTSIQGRLFSARDASPIVGLTVRARGPGPARVLGEVVTSGFATREATSDPDGRFAIMDVTPGLWRLELDSAEHFVDAGATPIPPADILSSLVRRGPSASGVTLDAQSGLVSVQVVEGVECPEVSIAVTTAGALAGRIRDARGPWLADAHVQAEVPGWSNTSADGRLPDPFIARAQTRSAGDGSYELKGLRPATWKIRIRNRGLPDVVTDVAIRGGETATRDFVVEPGLMIDVLLVGDGTVSTAGLKVVAYEVGAPLVLPLRDLVATEISDMNGQAALGPLRKGRYQIRLVELDVHGVAVVGPSTVDVEVSSTSLRIEIPVTAAKRLGGRVVDGEGTSVVGPSLLFLAEGAPMSEAFAVQADLEGRFETFIGKDGPFDILLVSIPDQPGAKPRKSPAARVTSATTLRPSPFDQTVVIDY